MELQPVCSTVLGLDIGGTKTACVEGAVDSSILQRVELPTRAAEPFSATFPGIVDHAQSLMATARREGRRIGAISVSIGGPLRIDEGFLINPPHLPGWHDVPLKARIMDAFPGLPVLVEHDGNAGALAEFHFGVGKNRTDLKHLIFLTFGTGVGGGFILNGQILRGASDTAGEIGHWRLAEDGPLGFGKRGSWESFASGAGLVELAAQMFPARWHSSTPIRTVVEAMVANDPQALEVAAEVGKWMGRGLALLIDALNPQVIAFGSLGVALGERVLGTARKVVAAEALPQAAAACELVPSVLGQRIGDVAALMAALTDAAILRQLEKGSGEWDRTGDHR
ncbi:MAG TPA: ROK family protein [Terracidiphilus sp.]|nr:ROK family protein [Terracidiphilus sp.]